MKKPFRAYLIGRNYCYPRVAVVMARSNKEAKVIANATFGYTDADASLLKPTDTVGGNYYPANKN